MAEIYCVYTIVDGPVSYRVETGVDSYGEKIISIESDRYDGDRGEVNIDKSALGALVKVLEEILENRNV